LETELPEKGAICSARIIRRVLDQRLWPQQVPSVPLQINKHSNGINKDTLKHIKVRWVYY